MPGGKSAACFAPGVARVDRQLQPAQRVGRIDRRRLPHLEHQGRALPSVAVSPKRPVQVNVEAIDVVRGLVPIHPLDERIRLTVADVGRAPDRVVELDRPKHVSMVGERECLHPELIGASHEAVDAAGAVEQAVVRVAVEVHEGARVGHRCFGWWSGRSE